MRFQVLTASEYEDDRLLDVAACSFVDIYRRFRGV
jgi:hypothetical protein